MQSLYLHTLTCLLLWLHPDPRNVKRLAELTEVARQVAVTDASDEEAELLVAICIHESRCHLSAVGDGGKSIGAWQVQGGDPSAVGALAKLRWSLSLCGNLAPYAGGKRCGDVPWVVASLADPSLPRR
jgi:hypothetical protein